MRSDPTGDAIRTIEAYLAAFGGEDSPSSVAMPANTTEGNPMTTHAAASHNQAPATQIGSVLGAVRALLELSPDGLRNSPRLAQAVSMMRAHTEQDQFPDAALPDAPGSDSVVPITYPRIELNELVNAARPAILALLNKVDIDQVVRTRLARELTKPTEFLEEDDRGTIGALIEPTGATPEKERNNSKLDALGSFLHALRRESYAVVRYALQILSEVAIPPELLSINLEKCEVTFRSNVYSVPEDTSTWLQMMLSANGGYVTTSEVAKKLGKAQIRSDRLVANLPEQLKNAILTDKRGSRLIMNLLLSYV